MSYTNGLDKPTDYFNTVLYTGTGSTHNVTGVGFQPDWSWLKCRSNLEGHELYDSVRGVTKMLTSNSDSAESTQSTALTSFDSDGFTLGSDFEVNASGRTFVSWNWLAGGTASSNTDGSITSSVSANTTSGFSIVSYAGNSTAGATVGHGLGSAIKFLWVKNRDDSGENHTIWHQDIPNTNALFLNSTDASASYTTRWNSTTPTSSVFTVGTSNGVNGSGKNYIAYCFAEKKGYSKFGSYTGNGNADGTFVYTGFKPAFIITKSSSTGGTYYNWGMWDTARSPSNVNNKILAANTSDDESNPSNLGANQNIDFLSNGFKHRSADVVNNQSGVTYIYMAFAESPFVTSSGIPTCAR